MSTYSIFKRTPATGWVRCIEGISADIAYNILAETCKEKFRPELMTGHINVNGDLIEYRADPED